MSLVVGKELRSGTILVHSNSCSSLRVYGGADLFGMMPMVLQFITTPSPLLKDLINSGQCRF
jgi:hypothetical protein